MKADEAQVGKRHEAVERNWELLFSQNRVMEYKLLGLSKYNIITRLHSNVSHLKVPNRKPDGKLKSPDIEYTYSYYFHDISTRYFTYYY